MLARSTRSGLVESEHTGAVAVVALDGGVPAVTASHGDIDRPFFFRSAIKPVQAAVSQRLGADLVPERLAFASASHSGHPIHIAYAKAMLAEVGLDESALECPPLRPLRPEADALWRDRGVRRPLPVLHNCSGKHAAMLRACVAQGWPLAGYSHPDHPLQQAMTEEMALVAGTDVGPVGVDGCGVPSFRGSAMTLATIFARVSSLPEYAEVAAAVTRYPSLVAGNLRGDGKLAAWINGPMKVGAQACFGAGVRGTGIGVKAFSGVGEAAVVAMVEAFDQLGLLSDAARSGLAATARPVVLGGGRPVGEMEPGFALERTR
ncbi:MAG: asparaginase [Acidimicrobiia bacterium]|nr:asparaginase [Acidimicrobiia bacterium]NNK91706.1 asparaginase [Acidimicrobiia bacterium]